MKSQPFLHKNIHDTKHRDSSEQFYSSGKHFTKNSTLNSQHTSSQSNLEIFARSSNHHKLNNKAPFMCFKKQNRENSQKNIERQTKIDHQDCQDEDSFLQIQKGMNQQRFQDQQHQQTSKLSKNKQKISEFFDERKIQCSKSLIKDCNNHQRITNLMADMQEKLLIVIRKTNEVQSKNKVLQNALKQRTSENYEKYQKIIKVFEEYSQLQEARKKWILGKENLECLYEEVSQKMEREKLSLKQNMSQEDCELYFKSKLKKKQVLKSQSQSHSHNNELNEGKGTFLQRLNIKIEKT